MGGLDSVMVLSSSCWAHSPYVQGPQPELELLIFLTRPLCEVEVLCYAMFLFCVSSAVGTYVTCLAGFSYALVVMLSFGGAECG